MHRLDEGEEARDLHAIRFGTVLDYVNYDEESRRVNYADDSMTENTRAAHPIERILNAAILYIGGQPRDIIFLTCDAFGALPPVSRLRRTRRCSIL